MMKEIFIPSNDVLIVKLPHGKIVIKANAVRNPSAADSVQIIPTVSGNQTFYLRDNGFHPKTNF